MKKMTKFDLIMASLITGNDIKYIEMVSNGKMPHPSKKNDYWGMGADKYYQEVIKGIVKSFRRVCWLIIIMMSAFIISLLLQDLTL